MLKYIFLDFHNGSTFSKMLARTEQNRTEGLMSHSRAGGRRV